MAKASGTKGVRTTVAVTPVDNEQLLSAFKVSEATSEEAIMVADSRAGTRLEFDFVHFKKLTDSFVAQLKPASQKAYWLAFSEYDDRVRRSNIALHEVGVDPLTKILDRPRGTNNPLVRDGEAMQKRLGGRWYVSWRVLGGQGDTLESLHEIGFRVMRRPADKAEEKEKDPFDWSGELWRVADGTSDPTSGDALYNVMVVIERVRWEDNLKAMSMASHNAYRQNKQQFIDGADNISRDMLGGKEKIIPPDYDLDKIQSEEHTVGGRQPR